ncbi:helix-turn-helix transcriptional regulator [Streptomyces sp. NPDC090106]|uniref:helix-turn-helix transcriptional regulator n=1 Tax=Streptomyces sp. NPDC090106 TaxID=3365946 RepID=UPI0038029CC6
MRHGRAGLTQEALAERSGVSVTTIRGLETGRRRNANCPRVMDAPAFSRIGAPLPDRAPDTPVPDGPAHAGRVHCDPSGRGADSFR